MKAPKHTDFTVPVDKIGKFTFARRTLRDEMAISAEYARLTEGAPVTGYAASVTNAMAELQVLTVAAPDGYDPEDLFDSETYDPAIFDDIMKIWGALREKEDTFRPARPEEAVGGEAAGAGAVEHDGAVVPSDVQPAAD